MTAFDKAWGIVKNGGDGMDRCEGCKIPTWPGQGEANALGIKDDGQMVDGQMVDVGGGPPMWLCDNCAFEFALQPGRSINRQMSLLHDSHKEKATEDEVPTDVCMGCGLSYSSVDPPNKYCSEICESQGSYEDR